jgi:hypothetical protein
MVNDGPNEAPALMAADVSMAPASVAVGKRGSETSTSPPILNCTLNRSGSQQQIRTLRPPNDARSRTSFAKESSLSSTERYLIWYDMADSDHT